MFYVFLLLLFLFIYFGFLQLFCNFVVFLSPEIEKFQVEEEEIRLSSCQGMLWQMGAGRGIAAW